MPQILGFRLKLQTNSLPNSAKDPMLDRDSRDNMLRGLPHLTERPVDLGSYDSELPQACIIVEIENWLQMLEASSLVWATSQTKYSRTSEKSFPL